MALARLLHQQADVLLLDEPTRGIDVGSKAEIYRLIGELAAAGKAILVVSSYLPELFGICDRIAVMSRGALCEARPVVAVDRARSDGSRDPRRVGPLAPDRINLLIEPSSIPIDVSDRRGIAVAASSERRSTGMRGASSCAAASAGSGRFSARSWGWS